MGTQTTNLFFNKLDKFNGDLSAWIKNVQRCCIISNIIVDVVRRQLLMVCVDRRAKAILEDYEETVKAQDADAQIKANDYIGKLKEIFQSDATKELNMSLFESRTQNVEETEEKFMYELFKLYKFANPGVTNDALEIAILHGISSSLRHNIVIFCNKPYNKAITRQNV